MSLVLVLAATIFFTAPAAMPAQADPVQELNAVAHGRFDAAEAATTAGDMETAIAAFQDAARLWLRAVDRLAADPARQGERGLYLSKALNVLRLAFERDRTRCHLLLEALTRVNNYRQSMLKAEQASDADREVLQSLDEQRAVLLGLREDHCKAPEPELGDDKLLIVPPGSDKLRQWVAEQQATHSSTEGPAPSPVVPVSSSNTQPKPNRVLPAITLSAAGLAVTFTVVSLGTGLSRIQQPFRGAAYNAIFTAARASQLDADPTNDVSSDAGTDMCSAGAQERNAGVASACQRFDTLYTASVVTGVLAGITAAVAISTGIVLVRRKPRLGTVARRLRLEPAQHGLALRF